MTLESELAAFICPLARARDKLRRKVAVYAMAGNHTSRAKAEAELRAVILEIFRRGQAGA